MFIIHYIEDIIPDSYVLEQNFPNHFNPTTSIRFQLPQSSNVILKIYSINGSLVRTLVSDTMPAGNYDFEWDGKSEAGKLVSSGVYLFHLQAGEFSAIKKMTLIK